MTFTEQCQREAKCVHPDDRQKFLDLIRDGKTIGQARAEMGLTLEAACGVIDTYIEHMTICRRESK